ncbi:MAG: efflux RND transporter permease subunit [Nitrospira sp.]|nr:efflux RND transporter permease subunit [Nitrospira sp.]
MQSAGQHGLDPRSRSYWCCRFIFSRCRARGALTAVRSIVRVRPKMMTVAAIRGGLLPIMWTTGTGADMMKRIAAPMIGGMVSSTVLTLLVIPVMYAL